MEKCKSQNINIAGIDYEIPFYYHPADPSPDDVPGAIPYLVSSPYARGYFSGYEIVNDTIKMYI